MDPVWLTMLAGGGGALLLGFFAFSGDRSVEKRLHRVGTGTTVAKVEKAKPVDRLTAVRQQYERGKMSRIAHHLLPNKEKLRELILQTGKKITLGHYIAWMLMAGIFGFLLFHFMFGWQDTTAGIVAIGLSIWLPFKILKHLGAKRAKAFLAHFPEAIDTMVRGLRSGLPIAEALNAIGREAPGAVGEEFSRITDAIRMGHSLDAAMWDVSKRVAIPEFRFLVISMAIQKETGGNLGETLGNLSELLRRRRQLKLKIKAMSSEARASAMIIGSLPFVMWCILYLVQSDYALMLFITERGHVLLGIGSFWMFMGIMVMKKMIAFEF